MPRLWQFTFLLSTITAIGYESSLYYIACDDNSSNVLESIDDSTATSFLSRISLPISTPNVTCLLGIFLSGNGSFTFEEDSECKISFEIQEVNNVATVSPTMEPSYPTMEPTIYPTQTPSTSNPTTTPTASPTALLPTTKPPTSAPTIYPTMEPTQYPTTDPTEVPTIEPTLPPFMDLDDIELRHIFNVNHDNIFWRNMYNSSEYYFQMAPDCGSNASFAAEDVLESNGNITALVSIFDQLPEHYGISTQTVTVNPKIQHLFPQRFSISSHDSSLQTLFTATMTTDFPSATNFSCYYDDAFATLNASFSGIDYYLFAQHLGSNNAANAHNLTLDIRINKACVTDTSEPSSAPTAAPTPFFEFSNFSSTVTEEESDEEILGVALETFIAICSVVFVILVASIVVAVCLYKRKSIWEDAEDNTIQLKEPKQHKTTELASNKFVVTEEDHKEMLELAEDDSVGLIE